MEQPLTLALTQNINVKTMKKQKHGKMYDKKQSHLEKAQRSSLFFTTLLHSHLLWLSFSKLSPAPKYGYSSVKSISPGWSGQSA